MFYWNTRPTELYRRYTPLMMLTEIRDRARLAAKLSQINVPNTECGPGIMVIKN